MKKKTKLQSEPAKQSRKGSPRSVVKEMVSEALQESALMAFQESTKAVDTAKPHRTGPPKEKVQITIRIDKELLDEAYSQMKADNTRLTDMIERGLVLAMGEARHALPQWTKQIRFVLANATKEQVALIRGLAIAMVEHEVVPLSHETRKFYEICRWFLELRNKLPHDLKCLELYSRYGKSAEEIAKLGN